MKNSLATPRTVTLFSGIKESDLQPLLSCLSAKVTHYEKGKKALFSV